MTRLHDDPADVRTRAEAVGPVPEEFRWRGRRYVVRDVLARWTATGPWWHAARDARTTAVAETGAVPDTEQLWWRVEADSGRAAAFSGDEPPPGGTYDLCLSWATGAWAVRRVLD